MFENIISFCKRIVKREDRKAVQESSKNAAKERLHLVLMQDRANVSADFLELMKQEIIEVIKKYIEVDEKEIDVRLTNKENQDGTNGAPALYANIPILNIKNDAKKIMKDDTEENSKDKDKQEQKKQEYKDENVKEQEYNDMSNEAGVESNEKNENQVEVIKETVKDEQDKDKQ